MKIIESGFKDLWVIEPKTFSDERGFLFEAYNDRILREMGVESHFVQDNISYSYKGVIRGMHFQLPPHAQTKLVRCLRGTIQDVVVDVRKSSDTFGKWFAIELSDTNKKALLIPKGFAHGFAVVSKEALVMFKIDDFFYPNLNAGIRYDDPALNIDWAIDTTDAIVAAKDMLLPTLKQAQQIFE